MKILRLWINTGFVGCDYFEDLEVPDDYTEEQCEEECKLFLQNNITYGWFLKECE